LVEHQKTPTVIENLLENINTGPNSQENTITGWRLAGKHQYQRAGCLNKMKKSRTEAWCLNKDEEIKDRRASERERERERERKCFNEIGRRETSFFILLK
jgi:hypothetical protein